MHSIYYSSLTESIITRVVVVVVVSIESLNLHNLYIKSINKTLYWSSYIVKSYQIKNKERYHIYI